MLDISTWSTFKPPETTEKHRIFQPLEDIVLFPEPSIHTEPHHVHQRITTCVCPPECPGMSSSYDTTGAADPGVGKACGVHRVDTYPGYMLKRTSTRREFNPSRMTR